MLWQAASGDLYAGGASVDEKGFIFVFEASEGFEAFESEGSKGGFEAPSR